MAINDLPTPTEPTPANQLRSYRETAATFLVECESGLRQQCRRPLEPSSPPSQRKAGSSPNAPTGRCRSRTPSPPHASPPSREASQGNTKVPRSVSPGGTDSKSPGSALRNHRQQGRSPSPNGRVRWASTLVSDVRTRPRTPRRDVAALFYSRADERRFRREADAREATEEEAARPKEQPLEQPSEGLGLWSPNRQRRDFGISKAVVVFDGASKTYAPAPLVGGCAVEAALENNAVEGFSFDDAAFWNGQLTWS